MKIFNIIFITTISFLFYSCETTTISHSNPLSYGREYSYFLLNPYILYSKLDNRIDYGIINNLEKQKDSIYVRGTFYNNEYFRDVGEFNFGNINIKKVEADELFKIQQLVEGFIKFGVAYFQNIDNLGFNHSAEIEITGNELPYYNTTVPLLDTSLVIQNINDLDTISKANGFKIITNDIGYESSRIRIFNESKNYLVYSNFKNEKNITPDLIKDIPNGNYNVECLKGHYIIDTLANDEQLIINIYSSVVFKTQIIE